MSEGPPDLAVGRPVSSIVVPTRNRSHLLPRLLAALDAQEFSASEVILVDDASTDRTWETLSAWKGEGRRALRLETPSGSYAARNLGWQAARGAIVAFTDDDCLPRPEWLSHLVRAMEGSQHLFGKRHEPVLVARPQRRHPTASRAWAYWRTVSRSR